MSLLILTTREAKILRYICRHIARCECAPTLRDIAGALGIHPPNRVAAYLDALHRKGWIRWTLGLDRSIEPAEVNFGPRQLLWGLLSESERDREQESCPVLCET